MTDGLRKLDADTIRALLDEIAAKDAEIERPQLTQVPLYSRRQLMAQLEAMRPVVEAAVEWNKIYGGGSSLAAALGRAVDAYEAKMKEVGDG